MKIIFVAVIMFFSLFGFSLTTPNARWVSGYEIVGNDTLLVDSVRGRGNPNWKVTYCADQLDNINSGYILAKSRCLLNGQPITTLFPNTNYADTTFYLMESQDTNENNVEILSYRLTRIEYYERGLTGQDSIDINKEFNVPFSLTPTIIIVDSSGNGDYTDIDSALNVANTGDTICLFDGLYTSYTLNKDVTLVAVGNVVVTPGSSYCSFNQRSVVINPTTIGIQYISESDNSYLFRVFGSVAGSSNTFKNCTFDAYSWGIYQTASWPLDNYFYECNINMPSVYYSSKFYLYDCIVGKYYNTSRKGFQFYNSEITIDRCLIKDLNAPNIFLSPVGNSKTNSNNSTYYERVTNSNPTSWEAYFNKCLFKYNMSGELFHLDSAYITLSNCSVDSLEILLVSSKLNVDSCRLYNAVIEIKDSTPDTFILSNSYFYNTWDVPWYFVNVKPIISNSHFDSYGRHHMRFYTTRKIDFNPIIENNLVEFRYKEENISYWYFTPLNFNTAYDTVYIQGNEVYFPWYYNNDRSDGIKHHLYLNFCSSTVFRWNYINGSYITTVTKDMAPISTLTNEIYGNIYIDCYIPIHLRDIQYSKVYNNTLTNYYVGIWIDKNVDGQNSIGTEVYNNIFSSDWNDIFMIAEAEDTLEMKVDNNLFYGRDTITMEGTEISLNDWFDYGFDVSSYNQDPLLNKKGVPQSSSVAMGSGKNLGEPYNVGLSPLSVWPDSVLLRNQIDNAWSIGAFIVYDKLSLSVSASPTNGGEVIVNPSDTNFIEGESLSIVAVAADGYEFAKWNTGELKDTLNITMIADLNLIAYFKQEDSYNENDDDNIFILTVNASPKIGGEVIIGSSDTSFKENDSVKIIAVAADGYEFANWNTGETEDTLNITMTSDLDLIAYFEVKDSDSTNDINSITEKVIEPISFKVYPNPVTNVSNLKISTNRQTYASVSLINITGKREVLFNGQLREGVVLLPIDSDSFNKGVYVLQIITDYRTYVENLIINN